MPSEVNEVHAGRFEFQKWPVHLRALSEWTIIKPSYSQLLYNTTMRLPLWLIGLCCVLCLQYGAVCQANTGEIDPECVKMRALKTRVDATKTPYLWALEVHRARGAVIDSYLQSRTIPPALDRAARDKASEAQASLAAQGAPAMESLVGIVKDTSEPGQVRTTALDLLLQLPRHEPYVAELTGFAKELFDEVLHDDKLTAMDRKMFPRQEGPEVNTPSPTLRKLLGKGLTNEKLVLSSVIEGLATSKDPRAQKLIREVLTASVQEAGGDKEFFSSIRKSIFKKWVTNPNESQLDWLNDLLTTPTVKVSKATEVALEISMELELLLDGARRKRESPPAISNALAPTVRRVVNHLKNTPKKDVLDSTLGRLVVYQHRMGELKSSDPMHPNALLPQLLSDAGEKPFSFEQRFYLQTCSTAMSYVAFDPSEMQKAHGALPGILRKLTVATQNLPDYDAQSEMNTPSEYTDIYFLLQSVPWQMYTAEQRGKMLTPFLADKYGLIEMEARKILGL